MAELYRYLSTSKGYIVYRDLCAPHVPVADAAEAHRVAVFVDDFEAADYCRYRNRLTEERGTDALR